MIWLGGIVFYLAVAGGIWKVTGFGWFHASATGRKSRPLLAVFWPLAVVAIVFILVISLIDLAYEVRADRTFGPERGE